MRKNAVFLIIYLYLPNFLVLQVRRRLPSGARSFSWLVALTTSLFAIIFYCYCIISFLRIRGTCPYDPKSID